MKDMAMDHDDRGKVHIQLLGRFAVKVGEEAIPEGAWHSQRARNLVKLLALAPGHRLHREQVMDSLWPDSDLSAATNNFHQTLYAARQVLDSLAPDFLRLEEGILDLSGDGRQALTVDVEQFEAAAALARDSQDLQAYQSALALYTGELLPEDRYEEWAVHRHDALHQTYLGLLLGLARLQEGRHDFHGGIDTLLRLLAADPSHEEAHTGLMRLYALGGHRQQALRQYQTLCQVLRDELDTEPSPATQALYEAIQSGQFGAAAPSPLPATLARRHNLPAQLTSFVGREQEIAEVRRLASEHRLVTLAGPGGIGKTRLALQAAEGLLDVFPDGVFLVELASLSDPELVPQACFHALGLVEQPGIPIQAVLAHYLEKRRLLLILDNCEHVIDACTDLAATLLKACPQLHILATSREILMVPGEVPFRVPSLAVPDTRRLPSLALLAQSEAVSLFVERAAQVSPGLALHEANASTIAQICQRLDGIPLAIELAASRVRMMSIQQVAARLDDTFRLLTGGRRAVLPHQQTLKATIDWSYDLLAPKERLLLQRLAVFAGGWTLEAAEAVCTDGDDHQDSPEQRIGSREVIDLLAQLVDKSLVNVEFQGDGNARYRLLEIIRQYAGNRLLEAGGSQAVRDRHLAYYAHLSGQAEPHLRGKGQLEWLGRIDRELDNLRGALAWALECVSPVFVSQEGSPSAISEGTIDIALRLANALGQFWHLRSLPSEGVHWLERVLALEAQERAQQPFRPERALLRAKALFTAGWLANYLEEMEKVVALSEESLALLYQLGQQGRHEAAYVLINLAELARKQGDHLRERALIEESLAIFREVEDKFGIADLLNNFLGVMEMMTGDYKQARSLQQEALALRKKIGDRDGLALSLTQLGWVALSSGDYAQAADLCQASLRDFEGLGNRYGACRAMYLLGKIAWAVGDDGRAAENLTGSLAVAREMGHEHGICYALLGLGQVACSQGDLSEAGKYYEESLDLLNEIRDRWLTALLVCAIADLSAARDQVELAVRFYAAAQEMYDTIHFVLSPTERAMHDTNVVNLRSSLGETSYQAAWLAGLALELEEAVQQARVFIKGSIQKSPVD